MFQAQNLKSHARILKSHAQNLSMGFENLRVELNLKKLYYHRTLNADAPLDKYRFCARGGLQINKRLSQFRAVKLYFSL